MNLPWNLIIRFIRYLFNNNSRKNENDTDIGPHTKSPNPKMHFWIWWIEFKLVLMHNLKQETWNFSDINWKILILKVIWHELFLYPLYMLMKYHFNTKKNQFAFRFEMVFSSIYLWNTFSSEIVLGQGHNFKMYKTKILKYVVIIHAFLT